MWSCDHMCVCVWGPLDSSFVASYLRSVSNHTQYWLGNRQKLGQHSAPNGLQPRHEKGENHITKTESINDDCTYLYPYLHMYHKYVCVYLSIHPSIDRSIYLSIYRSIARSIYLSIYLSHSISILNYQYYLCIVLFIDMISVMDHLSSIYLIYYQHYWWWRPSPKPSSSAQKICWKATEGLGEKIPLP